MRPSNCHPIVVVVVDVVVVVVVVVVVAVVVVVVVVGGVDRRLRWRNFEQHYTGYSSGVK